MRELEDELKKPYRVISDELGIPLVSESEPVKQTLNETTMLKVLAEDYRVNPGLFMSCADLKHNFDTDNEKIVSVLVTLEKDNIVKIYRNNGVIELAKATYSGLRKANPIEYYRWFPSRVSEDELF